MVFSFVQRAFRSFLYRSDRFWIPLWLRSLGIDLQGSVHFIGLPLVSLFQGSRIQIGSGSRICSRSFGTAIGVNHPVVLRTLTSEAKILIGERVGISGGLHLFRKRNSNWERMSHWGRRPDRRHRFSSTQTFRKTGFTKGVCGGQARPNYGKCIYRFSCYYS